MWKTWIAAAMAGLVVLPSTATAESPLGNALAIAVMLRACTAVEDDTARLACYDAMSASFMRAGTAGSSIDGDGATAETPPTWEITIGQSKIDDSPKVIMWLDAKEPVYSDWGRVTPALTVVCEENKTRAYVRAGTSLGYEDEVSVIYRMDQEPAVARRLLISTDRRAAGWWTGGEAIPFLKNLIGRSKLTVRLQPKDKARIEPVFDVTGMDEAIKPLREACNW